LLQSVENVQDNQRRLTVLERRHSRHLHAELDNDADQERPEVVHFCEQLLVPVFVPNVPSSAEWHTNDRSRNPPRHLRVRVGRLGLDAGEDVLVLELDEGVIYVAVGVQACERGKSLLVAALEGEPPRRLGKGVDECGERDHWQELEREREAPLPRALIL